MQHLLLDLYGCHPQELAHADYLRCFLSETLALIELPHRATSIHLEHITATSDPRDAGHSGLVLVARAHVSLHAWPPYGMLNLDICSSEDFDAESVVIVACAAFEATDHEVQLIQRATRSPRPAAAGISEVPPPSQHQPPSLDRCLHPGYQQPTGSMVTGYCQQHQPAAHQHPSRSLPPTASS